MLCLPVVLPLMITPWPRYPMWVLENKSHPDSKGKPPEILLETMNGYTCERTEPRAEVAPLVRLFVRIGRVLMSWL